MELLKAEKSQVCFIYVSLDKKADRDTTPDIGGLESSESFTIMLLFDAVYSID